MCTVKSLKSPLHEQTRLSPLVQSGPIYLTPANAGSQISVFLNATNLNHSVNKIGRVANKWEQDEIEQSILAPGQGAGTGCFLQVISRIGQ